MSRYGDPCWQETVIIKKNSFLCQLGGGFRHVSRPRIPLFYLQNDLLAQKEKKARRENYVSLDKELLWRVEDARRLALCFLTYK